MILIMHIYGSQPHILTLIGENFQSVYACARSISAACPIAHWPHCCHGGASKAKGPFLVDSIVFKKVDLERKSWYLYCACVRMKHLCSALSLTPWLISKRVMAQTDQIVFNCMAVDRRAHTTHLRYGKKVYYCKLHLLLSAVKASPNTL